MDDRPRHERNGSAGIPEHARDRADMKVDLADSRRDTSDDAKARGKDLYIVCCLCGGGRLLARPTRYLQSVSLPPTPAYTAHVFR